MINLSKSNSTNHLVKEIYKNLVGINEETWYGIQYDTASPSPVLLRIASDGGMWQHGDLPIQSKLRRCVIDNVTGELKYYLHPTDSTLKADGTDAILDGTDGQVMVEIPGHYRKCEEIETIVRVIISESELEGGVLVPKMYISAYEPTLDRTDPIVYKLASVVNADPAFRGGGNNDAWDEEPRTLLGRPVTSFTLDQFRHYASNRNAGDPSWNALMYEAHKALQWLYYIEYANFNSQAEFNAEDDFNGFKQGGLGLGATNFDGVWGYSEYYPFIPCGITNALGNQSGEIGYDIPVEFTPVTPTIMVCSYRGVENIFGHLWKFGDGVHTTTIMVGEEQKVAIWMTDDPSRFGDSSNRYFDLRKIANTGDGGISKFALGKNADTIGIEFLGDQSSTYMMDYGSLYGPDNACNIVLLAGYADSGSTAGLGCANSENAPSAANANVGSRLCFKTVGASAPRRAILETEVA